LAMSSNLIYCLVLLVFSVYLVVNVLIAVFWNPDTLRFNLPFVIVIGILVNLYLPLVSVLIYRRFGVRPNPRIIGPCIVIGIMAVNKVVSSSRLELTVFISAVFGAIYTFLVLYPARAITKCIVEHKECDWIDPNSLQRLGYSIEYSFPEPTQRAFWISNIVFQLSLYALLTAYAYLVNPGSLWLQMLVWILIAVIFMFIRLYTSNKIGRPICTTYISASTILLIFIALLILDYIGYIKDLVISRGLEIENTVYPALVITTINIIAFIVDAYTIRGGSKRFRELGLCIGQTPIVKIKDKG